MPTNLDSLRVVLVSPRNPLNIGAAARAMSNFGVQHLRVVNPYEVAFREARSAKGGADVLTRAQEFSTVADAVADCSAVIGTTGLRRRELQHPLRRLEYGARLLQRELATGPVALMFGSEKFGLSNADLTHCHSLIRIPTREEHLSMNLGQAVAVCLYELARDPRAARQPEKRQPATAGDLERITEALQDALQRSGYVTAGADAATEEKVRRMVHRLDVSLADSELVLGMLRQITWKLRSGKT